MTEGAGPRSWKLIAEVYSPVVFGGFGFFMQLWWLKFSLLDASWGNRLLDRVIQASAMGTAFWGVAITLLIGMDAKPVVIRLKAVGYYKIVVRYFGECLFATFVLLLLSILLEPLSSRVSPVLLTGFWLGAATWAIATTVRSYVVLANILVRAAE
ncbi:MAG TPA: hypothetical protein VNV41_16325 [Candidatus Acidoferrales bacterium]|nr:hypothetical protein [Candidatus Acidoferrales bacterium]